MTATDKDKKLVKEPKPGNKESRFDKIRGRAGDGPSTAQLLALNRAYEQLINGPDNVDSGGFCKIKSHRVTAQRSHSLCI